MNHALLGPSGAERWLNCTPSARFEENFEETTSVYAEEGTAAHALVEALLKNDEDEIKTARASEYYNAEMESAAQQFVDITQERYAEARSRCSDALLFSEQKLHYNEWVPGGFGTGDVLIISDDHLEVIDFKYGKGVPVSAPNNPQLYLYALGAYQEFYSILYDIDNIKTTIIQPRLDNISSDELTTMELLDWAEYHLKPRARDAWKGVGVFIPGEYCRFCRGKVLCHARAERNKELAALDFLEPNMLSVEQIAEILAGVDELIAWAGDIKDYALEQASKHGTKWPGFKLVEGRSNRKYSNHEAVINTLLDKGFKDIFKPQELIGITEMEKLLGKKRFKEYLEDLIIKPAGKPVLAKESDKRPELKKPRERSKRL